MTERNRLARHRPARGRFQLRFDQARRKANRAGMIAGRGFPHYVIGVALAFQKISIVVTSLQQPADHIRLVCTLPLTRRI
jgi:hypothetical protein